MAVSWKVRSLTKCEGIVGFSNADYWGEPCRSWSTCTWSYDYCGISLSAAAWQNCCGRKKNVSNNIIPWEDGINCSKMRTGEEHFFDCFVMSSSAVFFFFAQQTSHAKWKPKISTFGSLSRINPFRDVYTNYCSMNVPSGGWDFQDGGTTIARPASRWIWPKAIAPPHLVNLHFPFWYDFLAERYSIKYLICGFVLI